MIVSQVLYPKHSPESLSMVVVSLANCGQVEFAVKCLEAVFIELLPIIHVYVEINSLYKQQSELFICRTDSEIIEDQVNLQLPMTYTSALPTYSMSDIVLIDVGEFHFTFAPFAHHPIHPNQIPESHSILESQSKLLAMSLKLSMNCNCFVIYFISPKGVLYSFTAMLMLKLMYFSRFSEMDPELNFFPNSLMNRCTS